MMFLIGGAAYGLEIGNVQQAEANFRVKNTFTKGRSFSETYREKQAQTSLLRQYVFCAPFVHLEAHSEPSVAFTSPVFSLFSCCLWFHLELHPEA